MKIISRNLPRFRYITNKFQQRKQFSTSHVAREEKKPVIQRKLSLENNTAYRFLKSQPKYIETFYDSRPLDSEEKWREFDPVINRFRGYAVSGKDFNDNDFDADEVESIIAKKSSFNDEEVKALLYLTTLPAHLPNFKATNFEKFWRSLDQECVARSKTWTYNELFSIGELWYLNSLCNHTDFHWYLVKKMFRRCEKLTAVEFIRFLFNLNLVRQIPKSINTYELEHCLSQHVDSLNAVEASIAAMAFFKTQTPIRDFDLLTKFIAIAISDAPNLESVFVAALSKVGRLSGRGKTSAVLYTFQEAFLPEVERLNMPAVMHLAIIGTRTQVLHEPLLLRVLRKVEKDLDQTRLKEIERLLLVFTMFDVDCDAFCHKVIEELKNPNRLKELEQYGRVYLAILFYITMRQIYPYDLISQVLDSKFLIEYFGKNTPKYQREILCLDFTMGLECPDYEGNRLEEKVRKTAAKHNLLWLWPESHEKVSAYEQSVRTAAHQVRTLLGGKDYVHICNILPHFHSAELVFFLDENNSPVKVPPSFIEIPNYNVKTVPTELKKGVTPHAILVGGYNSVVRNRERTFLGQVKLQLRQLCKLGYKVHTVFPEDVNYEVNEPAGAKIRRAEIFQKIILGEERTNSDMRSVRHTS